MAGEATFGTLLRQHRQRARLSQEELAARALVSTRAISDLERGVNNRPRLHTAIALADGLGLDGEARAEFEQHARAESEPDPSSTTPNPAVIPERARPPLTLDSFIDDGSMLGELLALLGDDRHRVITLLGPGGVGKTRLALELARRVDGPIAFVGLASLSDASLMAATVGAALGVDHGPTRTHLQSLIEHLGSRSLTLVLDNLEQIVDSAPDLAALVRSCPGLRLIVTSRVPLRVTGELRFAVRPLAAAQERSAASVRLFVDRAAAAGAEIADDELPAVAQLCSQLDGLPLAIELAAARSVIVRPAEMLKHFDQALDVLGSGRSDAPLQHASLRAALEWSYRLLPTDAQHAFAALGVFASAASTEAAMCVWGLAPTAMPALLDLVQVLAEAHLVSVDRSGGEAIRIDMFETTRQFAREKLDESDAAEAVRRRFTEWAVGLVDRAELQIVGPDQLEWLASLDRELPNLRAAGRRLNEQAGDEAIEAGLRIAAGLQRYWDIRSRWSEGAAWLREALSRPAGPPAVRGKAQKALGVMHRCLGELDTAEIELRRAVVLYETAGDQAGAASCLNNLGIATLDRADYLRAADLLRQSLELCVASGDRRLEPLVLNNIALATSHAGDLRTAFRLYRRSNKLLAELGNVSMAHWVNGNLATVLASAGFPRRALPIQIRALRNLLEYDAEGGFVWALEALAATWTMIGDTDRAGHALGFVTAHRKRLGALPAPYFLGLTDSRRQALIDRIGADRANALFAEGAALDPAEVRGWFQ